MSILYDKTCFIKDVKPPRATTSKRPMTNNAVSEGTIQALSRFCARGLIVGVCLNRHKNRCSRCFFFRWNIVRDQNLHIADIAHHEARDAHQQRHAAKQHKHESHAGTMADTDQWTKHSCQDSSSHHPWLEYEVGQRSSGQHAYGHRDLRDHQARTKDFTLHVVRHLRLPDSVVAAVEKWDDERAEKPGDEPDGQRSAKPHEHDTQGGHRHHAPQDAIHLAARTTPGRHECSSDDAANGGYRVNDTQCRWTVAGTRQDHWSPQRHAYRPDKVRCKEGEL